MILVVNVCKERLHSYEFVKPVEDILSQRDDSGEPREGGVEFFIRHYSEIKKGDLANCDKVIICGTSLGDSEFLKDLKKFNWLKNFEKPVFGICAGFQILGLVFGGELKRKLEIGFFRESFGKEFLGLSGEVEVYHLHNNYIDFSKIEVGSWELGVGSSGGIVQAFRWKNFYGVLFHPEVRNKEMILKFAES